MNEEKLRMLEGLMIQVEDLTFWNKVLKSEYYEMLEERVYQENNKLTKDSDGYDVFRGDQIATVAGNFRYL